MQPLLIFDGDCGFCTTSANWMERQLNESAGVAVDVAPWQRLDLPSLGLSQAEVATAAYWLDDRRTARGHRAVGYALRAIGGWWTILGWLCLIPPTSWIAALAYRLIARFRYRMPGGTPACRLEQHTTSARKKPPSRQPAT